MQCPLDVAFADNTEVADSVNRDGTNTMVLAVSHSLAWRNNNRITSVDTHGIKILHITHCEAVVVVVTHDFIFDFFPVTNIFFDENLVNAALGDADGGDFFKFLLVVSYACAFAPECVCDSDHDGVTDLISYVKGLFDTGGSLAF